MIAQTVRRAGSIWWLYGRSSEPSPDRTLARAPASRTTRRAARSIEAAADVLRPDIVLPSAVRWVRRRLTLVRTTLLAVVTLLPDLLGGPAHLGAVRAALHTDHALVILRARAATLLSALPRPLGFVGHVRSRSARRPRRQHRLGADSRRPSG